MIIDYGYVERISVQFDDLDAIGFVHNSRYALFVERAHVAYWSRLGFGYDGRNTHPDAFAVVGEFSIKYFIPIQRMGDINIHIWTERIGTTSATFGFRLISPDDETVYAEGRRVHIKIDPVTMRPSPWSEEVRKLALALVHPNASTEPIR